MKIPNQIKIAGLIYTCRMVPLLTRDFSATGRSCYNAMQFEIDDSLPQQIKESTLIHEIIEQINSIYELGLTHEKITILETALYQVIQDNQEIFRG